MTKYKDSAPIYDPRRYGITKEKQMQNAGAVFSKHRMQKKAKKAIKATILHPVIHYHSISVGHNMWNRTKSFPLSGITPNNTVTGVTFMNPFLHFFYFESPIYSHLF